MVQFHSSAPGLGLWKKKISAILSTCGRSSTVEHSPVTGEAVGSAPIARARKSPEKGFSAARAKQANDFACVGVLTGGARFF
jgi:hypothetical protein